MWASRKEEEMPLVDVRHIPSVALSFMNDDHHLEACLLNELADAIEELRGGGCSTGDVVERFDALLSHTREHFAREEAGMDDTGFPAYPVHKAEHDRVLDDMAAECHQFQRAPDVERLWRYVSETVPSWFVTHIQSMDLVTSRYIAARAAA
jgi:hemerythrin